MIRKFLLVGALVVAIVGPARAQDQCVAPKAPVIPDGARATPNQILAAQNEIKNFAAASDNYQHCLAEDIARQKVLAARSATELDPGVQIAAQAKSAAQMKDAQQLASTWIAAVEAFNQAQQRKQRQPGSAPSPSGGSGYGGGYGNGGRY